MEVPLSVVLNGEADMASNGRLCWALVLVVGLSTLAWTATAMSIAPVFGPAVHGLQLAYFYDAFAPEGRATFVLKNTTRAAMHVYVRNSCTGYEPFSIAVQQGSAAPTIYALGEKVDCQTSQPIYQTIPAGTEVNVSIVYPHPGLKKGGNRISGVLETRYPFRRHADDGPYQLIRLESPAETRVVK